MNDWVYLIGLVGWLILAIGSYRAQRLGAKRSLVMLLAWGSIFVLLALIFGAVAPSPAPWRP